MVVSNAVIKSVIWCIALYTTPELLKKKILCITISPVIQGHLHHSSALGSMEVIVGTDPEVVLQTGERGMLPCRVGREVAQVTWSRGPELSMAAVLTILQFLNGKVYKTSQGYADGLYDITDDFTLIINESTIDHIGNYFCEILDSDSGRPIANNTNVIVFGECI